MSENAHGPQTTENVAYSDFMTMNKITNMLISYTRDTLPHDPSHARSTIHSVVAVPCTLLQNLLVSLTRQWFPHYCVFAACTNVLLAHAWHIFLMIANCCIKITNENMLQKQARHRFGICTCHGCLQNASVARHFLQKGDCHSKISSRLSRKQVRNSSKCILSSLILKCCMIIFEFRTSQMTTSLLINR